MCRWLCVDPRNSANSASARTGAISTRRRSRYVPPLAHHFDAFVQHGAVTLLDSRVPSQKHVACLAGFQLEHPAAERVPFNLTAQPPDGRVPRCRQSLAAETVAILEPARTEGRPPRMHSCRCTYFDSRPAPATFHSCT